MARTTDPLTQVGRRGSLGTPQQVQARADQVQNHAGGYVFKVQGDTRIRRFLTMGVTGGTFYQKEDAYTRDNAQVVIDWATHRSAELVSILTEISVAGRAPRQNPALFALAAAFSLGDLDGRRAAAAALPRVARTASHLFTFAGYAEQFRGWGRALRTAVASWYLDKDPDSLAYQLVKYRQRDGWTHRDMLRSAHSTRDCDAAHAALFDWLCKRPAQADLPRWVTAYERARGIETGEARFKARRYAALVTEFPGIPWEALPDEALNVPAVWEAMLAAGVPQTALVRQLPRLTSLGLLKPMSSTLQLVTSQLRDPERLRKARVHPFWLLVALKTYASGAGTRGATWVPSQPVVDALDEAFYAAFGTVEPAGKRTSLNFDISGSMGWSNPGGLPVTCREVTAAVGMVTAATEPHTMIKGFGTRYDDLAISPRKRLDDNLAVISGLDFQGTDCSLPMVWALKNRAEIDTFVIYTDNETWFGNIHPHQALENYRQSMGIPARLAVVAMTATDFSIADPEDAGQLDVTGFSSDMPATLSSFSRGDI